MVAILTGMFTYLTALSTKEKEVKLSVYEKLGSDAHKCLESLYNNTEWLIMALERNKKNITPGLMRETNDQYPPKIDNVRELRVRLAFFDRELFDLFDEATKKHGEITPKLFGLQSMDGTKAMNPKHKYTVYEVNKFIYSLRDSEREIYSLKELVLAKTAKEYRMVLNQSSYFMKVFISSFITIVIILFCMVIIK